MALKPKKNPALVAVVGAAVKAAAKAAAKKSAKGTIKKTVAKGSGKPKYQNVTKEARTKDVRITKPVVDAKNTVRKAFGKKEMNPQQLKSTVRKEPNLAKQIDREEKIARGVRTQKPSTPKVPVKKKK